MKNSKLSQNSQDFEMVPRVAVVTFYQAGNSMAFQSLLSCTLVSKSKKSNNQFGILSLKIHYFKTVRNLRSDLLVITVSKFPRGLVVRIRRSHRRGPGSIPGVGSFYFDSLSLCDSPGRSLTPVTKVRQIKQHRLGT